MGVCLSGWGYSYQVFHFGDSLSSRQANFNGNYPYGNAAKGPVPGPDQRRSALTGGQWLRPVRHARQRLGVVCRLVRQGLLRR